MKARAMKKIVRRLDCENILALVRQRKARIIKEYTPDGSVYMAFTNSGAPVGEIGKRWLYLFKENEIEIGNRDGLFEGMSQTMGGPK
jgi:hypothetical protein